MNSNAHPAHAPNWVEVHFAYATRLFPGQAIKWWQYFNGSTYYQFVHVSFQLSNGTRFDRCNGQTIMTAKPEPWTNGVVVLVPSPHTNEEISQRAFEYLMSQGDRYFDCSKFVAYCLDVPHSRSFADCPADLFVTYATRYHELLGTIAIASRLPANTSPAYVTPPKRVNDSRHLRRDVR